MGHWFTSPHRRDGTRPRARKRPTRAMRRRGSRRQSTTGPAASSDEPEPRQPQLRLVGHPHTLYAFGCISARNRGENHNPTGAHDCDPYINTLDANHGAQDNASRFVTVDALYPIQTTEKRGS